MYCMFFYARVERNAWETSMTGFRFYLVLDPINVHSIAVKCYSFSPPEMSMITMRSNDKKGG